MSIKVLGTRFVASIARVVAAAALFAAVTLAGAFTSAASAAAVPDTGTTTAGTPVTVNVGANDSCPTGYTYANTWVLGQFGDIAPSASNDAGTWNVTGGSITYTPASGFTGSAQIGYDYSCSTAEGAFLEQFSTLTINVGPAAETPIIDPVLGGAVLAGAAVLAGGMVLARRRRLS